MFKIFCAIERKVFFPQLNVSFLTIDDNDFFVVVIIMRMNFPVSVLKIHCQKQCYLIFVCVIAKNFVEVS